MHAHNAERHQTHALLPGTRRTVGHHAVSEQKVIGIQES